MAKLIPAGAKGVDYSFARPSPAALAADGNQFAFRYVGRAGSTSKKILTRAEAVQLWACGVATPIVFEDSAARPLAGFAAGLADGQEAKRYCQDVLGMPAGYPITVAYDTDALPTNISAFIEYGRGFALGSAPYPNWAYGDQDIIEALGDLGYIVGAVRANASWWSRFWSRLFKSKYTNVIQGTQSPDHSVDYNTVLLPFFAWDGDPLPHPAPDPTVPTEDDLVIRLLAPTDNPARFFAQCTSAGVALRCEWTGDGSDPKVSARIAAHQVVGMTELSCTVADLINVSLDGVLPPGFTPDQFANTDELVARQAGTVDPEARALAGAAVANVQGLVDKLHAV